MYTASSNFIAVWQNSQPSSTAIQKIKLFFTMPLLSAFLIADSSFNVIFVCTMSDRHYFEKPYTNLSNHTVNLPIIQAYMYLLISMVDLAGLLGCLLLLHTFCAPQDDLRNLMFFTWFITM